MIPIIMYRNGYRNPNALSYKDDKLANELDYKDVVNHTNIKNLGCKNISQYECARMSDGGFCLLIASKDFIDKNKIDINRCCKIIGGSSTVNSMNHDLYLFDKNIRYN